MTRNRGRSMNNNPRCLYNSFDKFINEDAMQY